MRVKTGQTAMEYIIFISVATTALFYMGPAMKRGLQGLVKVTADQIGNQQNADQDVDKPIGSGVRNPNVNELLSETTPIEYSGYLVESNSSAQASSNKAVRERGYGSSVDVYERTHTIGNAVTDLGFTKQ